MLTLSLLINRIATVALTITGLSREAAKFQARSAFTGVGFTTNEAELIVNHPVRRRIAMLLMLLGNVGVVTSISSLLLTFIDTGGIVQSLVRVLFLVAGLLVLWGLATSPRVDRFLSRLILWALRRYTRLEIRDYVSLLNLSGEYQVTELEVQVGSWLADRRLSKLQLNQEGILVLGIWRGNGRYVGAPRGNTLIRPRDTLILYGRSSVLSNLDIRNADLAGEQAHQQAVVEQRRQVQRQEQEEEADNLGE